MHLQTPSLEILTVGHSSLGYENFLANIRRAAVTAIADVRSAPYSRHDPQFNRDTLKSDLRLDGIAYVFLGDQLGGRPKHEDLFCNGVADYEKMAATQSFAGGLKRVIEGAKKYRIAMMCSEHDPLECHRCLLVGRALHQRGVAVKHILFDSSFITHSDIEMRLLKLSRKSNEDFFESNEDRLVAAYRQRSLAVAYSERKPTSEDALE
jgi:uncharacterized protein (DUF488 family)